MRRWAESFCMREVGVQEDLTLLGYSQPCYWHFFFSFSKEMVAVVLLWSRVQLFVTPWTAAHQALLSSTISWSLLKFMSTELVMLSNHLILCCSFLLLPSGFVSIRVFFKELALLIRLPKYWSFSFTINPSNEYSGLNSLRISLQSKGLSRVFSSTTIQKHQFFSTQSSLWSNSHIHTWLLENHSFD